MPPLSEFLTFAAVGALAQLIDGSLGMAFGVASAAMLLGLGVPPVLASASVHYAEAFTCGASGASHWVAGNVRRRLFWTLAIPGVTGALIGAYVLIHVPAAWVRLALTPYLLGIGVFLLARGHVARTDSGDVPRCTLPLGAIAGFADAIAGGGWSALTVTALVARGVTPRAAIGTVHLAKCAVSVAAGISFLLQIGSVHVSAVLGLVAGGVITAPLGALFVRRMPARLVTVLAAVAVLGLGVNNLVRAFH